MDTLNKIVLTQDHLTYKYKGDSDINIAVLGMVDDTLAISQCGIASIQKNAVINSFIETQRLIFQNTKVLYFTLATDPSVVKSVQHLEFKTAR